MRRRKRWVPYPLATTTAACASGRTGDAVPVGVMTEYNGDGPREGKRAWLCDESAQVKDYARACITQAKEHYGSYGGVEWMGMAMPKTSYGYSYRIVSESMKAEYDEIGIHQFDEWVIDI